MTEGCRSTEGKAIAGDKGMSHISARTQSKEYQVQGHLSFAVIIIIRGRGGHTQGWGLQASQDVSVECLGGTPSALYESLSMPTVPKSAFHSARLIHIS